MYPEEHFNTIDQVEASVVLHDPRKAVNPLTEGITLTTGKYHQVYPTIVRFIIYVFYYTPIFVNIYKVEPGEIGW